MCAGMASQPVDGGTIERADGISSGLVAGGLTRWRWLVCIERIRDDGVCRQLEGVLHCRNALPDAASTCSTSAARVRTLHADRVPYWPVRATCTGRVWASLREAVLCHVHAPASCAPLLSLPHQHHSS